MYDLLAPYPVDDALLEWSARAGDLENAWRTCPRADWMMAIALSAAADRALVVLAAVDCAALAMRATGASEPSATRSMVAARRWASGEASYAECWAAAFGASGIHLANEAARDAVRAAACAAFACDADADAMYYAQRGHACEAAAHAMAAVARNELRLALCELVRRRISAAHLQDAFDEHAPVELDMTAGEPGTDRYQLATG